MPSKYLIHLLLFLACLPSAAQNVPDLNATAPSGSATAIPLPPDLSTSAEPSWTKTYIPQLPETNSANINYASNPANVKTMTTYSDGFNRPVQSVQHFAVAGSKPHLVSSFDTRFQQEPKSFLPYPAADASYHNNMFAFQQYYYSTAYPGEGYTAYSGTKDMSGSQQRAVKEMAPGLSQIGQNRGALTMKTTNAANEIKMWKPDTTGKPTYQGTYAAGMLLGETISDTSGAVTTIYKDRNGRTICKIIKEKEENGGGGGVVATYNTIYFVYDDMGRLVCTMPPKASANSNTSVSQIVFDNLCFQYRYDEKGRLAAQRFPGEGGMTEMVYDLKDRIVMRRSPQMANTAQWEVTFYDMRGRIKATSIYSNSASRSTWQNIMDAGGGSSNQADLSFYLLTPQGEDTYPAENAISGNYMLSYTYYDNYDQCDPGDTIFNNCLSILNFTEALSTPGAEAPIRAKAQHDLITGSRIRIIPAPGADTAQTGDWRLATRYYDNKGRVIFTTNFDLYHGNPIHVHCNASQYDFTDRVLITKHVMQNANGSTQQHQELTRNEYDPVTGKMTKSWRKTDTSIWVVQTMFSNDELGRTKRKVLGNYGEVQDYTYNIRGQLSGINEYYARTGDRQGESRSFGQFLGYDYGFTLPRYDGKISGMLWRGAGASLASAYGYSYDAGGRLTNAEYRRYEPPSGSYFGYAWRKDLADYTVSNLQYDKDGNIKKMMQKGVEPGGNIVSIDQLVYTYEDNERSSRLSRVYDSSGSNIPGDFKNTNGNNVDYAYDLNGNLTLDNNKGITSATYTYLDRPQVVTFAGTSKTIRYSYDAEGNKVQELVTSGSVTKQTDYIGSFMYENNQVKYVLTPEGRSVYDANNNKFIEEYFVKDYLGNVRSVVEVYVPPIQEYLGTYEIASANLEGLYFDHHSEIRDDKPGGVPGDNQAGVLNGAYADKRIGTSMLLHVMAGDKIEMNVNNFYEGYQPQNDAPVDAEEMLATIISTLRGGTGGFEGSESHDIKTVTDVFTVDNYSVFDQILNNNIDPSKPRAFLNYVMFDENMMIVPNMSGAFQADGEGGWTQIGTSTPLEFPTNGYLAVYLSNASQNVAVDEYGNVYFDQIVIRLSRGRLKEEAHYYPHGLPINGMGSTASGAIENRKKYQSNDLITDLDLKWMDFQHRQYDPQIGRFLASDPLSDAGGQEVFSSFAAMGNNPVSFVDPDGKQITFTSSKVDGKEVITMTITGKLVNESEKLFSADELQKFADRVASSIKSSFSGNDGSVIWNAVVNITAATAENPLTATDHKFRIVDKVPTSGEGFGAVGSSLRGGKVISILKTIVNRELATEGAYAGTGKDKYGSATLERTSVHELGHTGTLDHPTVGTMNGNAMHQTIQRNAGMKITKEQILQIKKAYKEGRLNLNYVE